MPRRKIVKGKNHYGLAIPKSLRDLLELNQAYLSLHILHMKVELMHHSTIASRKVHSANTINFDSSL